MFNAQDWETNGSKWPRFTKIVYLKIKQLYTFVRTMPKYIWRICVRPHTWLFLQYYLSLLVRFGMMPLNILTHRASHRRSWEFPRFVSLVTSTNPKKCYRVNSGPNHQQPWMGKTVKPWYCNSACFAVCIHNSSWGVPVFCGKTSSFNVWKHQSVVLASFLATFCCCATNKLVNLCWWSFFEAVHMTHGFVDMAHICWP